MLKVPCKGTVNLATVEFRFFLAAGVSIES